MADIAELIDQRNYVRDRNGKEAATRSFRVLEAGNEIGARDAFYALADSRIFPGAPGLTLDRVEVDNRAGNTLWVVKASYSSFGGFLRQEFNAAYVWGWDYKAVTVDVPFMSRSTKLVENPAGGSSALIQYWAPKITKVEETRVLRTLELTYIAANTNELDPIANQHNKYHYIEGRMVLFRGAQVRRDAGVLNQFRITYTWELDKGTIARASDKNLIYLSGSSTPPATAAIPYTEGIGVVLGIDYEEADDKLYGSGARLIRPPYYRLDVVVTKNRSTDFLDLPRAVGILDHDIDELGWMTLPGVVR